MEVLSGTGSSDTKHVTKSCYRVMVAALCARDALCGVASIVEFATYLATSLGLTMVTSGPLKWLILALGVCLGTVAAAMTYAFDCQIIAKNLKIGSDEIKSDEIRVRGSEPRTVSNIFARNAMISLSCLYNAGTSTMSALAVIEMFILIGFPPLATGVSLALMFVWIVIEIYRFYYVERPFMLNEFDKMTGNAIEPSSKAAAPSIWQKLQKLVFHLMVALLCVRDTLTGAAGIIGFIGVIFLKSGAALIATGGVLMPVAITLAVFLGLVSASTTFAFDVSYIAEELGIPYLSECRKLDESSRAWIKSIWNAFATLYNACTSSIAALAVITMFTGLSPPTLTAVTALTICFWIVADVYRYYYTERQSLYVTIDTLFPTLSTPKDKTEIKEEVLPCAATA